MTFVQATNGSAAGDERWLQALARTVFGGLLPADLALGHRLHQISKEVGSVGARRAAGPTSAASQERSARWAGYRETPFTATADRDRGARIRAPSIAGAEGRDAESPPRASCCSCSASTAAEGRRTRDMCSSRWGDGGRGGMRDHSARLSSLLVDGTGACLTSKRCCKTQDHWCGLCRGGATVDDRSSPDVAADTLEYSRRDLRLRRAPSIPPGMTTAFARHGGASAQRRGDSHLGDEEMDSRSERCDACGGGGGGDTGSFPMQCAFDPQNEFTTRTAVHGGLDETLPATGRRQRRAAGIASARGTLISVRSARPAALATDPTRPGTADAPRSPGRGA